MDLKDDKSDAEAARSSRRVGLMLPTHEITERKSHRSAAEQNRESHLNYEIKEDVQDNKESVQSASNVGSRFEGSELAQQKWDRLKKKTTVVQRLFSVSHELSRLKTVSRAMKPPGASVTAFEGLKFIIKTDGDYGWDAVEKKFNEITKDTKGMLPRSKFGECVGMNSEFGMELFDALARRRKMTEESITKDQLKEFWNQISDESFESLLQIFFDIIDKDADGILTKDEVKEIISLSATANKLSRVCKRADEYAAFIMEELDPNNLGYVGIENLKSLMLQASTHTVVTTRERTILRRMQSQKPEPTQHLKQLMQRFRDMRYSVLDNLQRVLVIALWLTVTAVLFAYKFIQYKHRAVYQVMGNCVSVAKGAAETLKLNMALILLPVCRNTLTWLRNKTKLGGVVPFDDNIKFHQVIAMTIAIGVGMHVITHMACDFPRLLSATPEAYSPLKQYFGDVQPTSYWHFMKSVEGITGILMVLLMAIAFTLATPWFRRGRLENLPGPLKNLASFNAFWYTHHLFVLVYALLLIHGYFLFLTHIWHKKTTWMYLAIPVTLYACERLIRVFRSNTKPFTVLKVDHHPGDVLGLRLSRPKNFEYKSGQYIFVKCPAVSAFEWHPFSLTSAPQDDYLNINIKNQGDWTFAIREVFSEKRIPPPGGNSDVLKDDSSQGATNLTLPEVMIDGPYGAPAQDYKEYEVVLLVGLGIGATPMISIIKDIVNNIKTREESPLSLMESGESQLHDKNVVNVRKVYFYWITPDQGTFDWFKNIMNEVAECDHNHVIELHNYCSKVYEEGDVQSAFIVMLQLLYHAKKGVDIVSGTRVMSHFGKPKWTDVYKRIETKHPNTTVGVFYCGRPDVAVELKRLALAHRTSTKFSFHKENF